MMIMRCQVLKAPVLECSVFTEMDGATQHIQYSTVCVMVDHFTKWAGTYTVK